MYNHHPHVESAACEDLLNFSTPLPLSCGKQTETLTKRWCWYVSRTGIPYLFCAAKNILISKMITHLILSRISLQCSLRLSTLQANCSHLKLSDHDRAYIMISLIDYLALGKV